MLEEGFPFECPYCGETIEITIDHTGGAKQKFVTDCEVCCQPIDVSLKTEDGEVTSFQASRND